MRRAPVLILFGIVEIANLVVPAARRDAAADLAATPVDLTQLSLDELLNVEVTSVSKRAEKRSEAAAAIAVITADDIRRSGATSLAEALRLAPGLHVARVTSDSWAIASRGFSSSNSEKLLVLMDGRSLYTPLFSGVFWDVQDTLLEDVDRIEVIRGPGGTLWGANAMNGVINIVTKSARDTQGALVEGGGGSEERGFGGFRWGGAVGNDFHYRVYGKYFDRDGGRNLSGPADDDWREGRLGFRSDWDVDEVNALTVQGDLYRGTIGQVVPSIQVSADDSPGVLPRGEHDADVSGGNALARLRHVLGAADEWSLQVYYDRTARHDPTFRDDLDTLDVDLQRRIPLPGRQDVLVGVGYRLMLDEFAGRNQPFTLRPGRSHDQLVSGFVQDEIRVTDAVRVILGTKLERNDFSGLEVQPSGRFLWDAADGHVVWGAVSRAVRTPTRIERDAFAELSAPTDDPAVRVVGNRHLDAEELTAFELGYRLEATPDLLFDFAGFYDAYDRLSTFTIAEPFAEGGRTVIPALFGNRLNGRGYGGEATADWRLRRWWRCSAAYSYLGLHLHTQTGASDPEAGAKIAGATPRHQVALRSFLDLPHDLELDGALRYEDALANNPETAAPEGSPRYFELDLRLGWRYSNAIELAAVGQNLLAAHHTEYPGGTDVQRGAYGKITIRF